MGFRTGSLKMPLLFFILLLYAISCNCCVHLPKEECSSIRNKNCYCKNSTLICCNIVSNTVLKGGLKCTNAKLSVKNVYIYNATIKNFDLRLEEWTKLESLSIINGNITKFQGRFSDINLSCMNLSGNGIVDIGSETFKKLRELRTLDVSKNNLTKIPNILLDKKKELTLDISNNKIRCKDIVDLLIGLRNDSSATDLKFKNSESTNCLTEQSFHWFSSRNVMPLSHIQELTKLDEACPSGMNSSCTCKAYRTDFSYVKNPVVKFSVNCSNLQLTELPPLPANTIYLDVSNNQISSLELLTTNKNYSEVRMLYADNNKIESIAVLEGSSFIDQFYVLSLRNNKIKSIPTYILSNAFDSKTYFFLRTVKFGENRLNCDCSTAFVKMWLVNNKNCIQDYDEVLCDKGFERVIDIDPSKVCITEKDWTDYIYYIIAGEALLLILLFSKVSYDYWVFKTSGYLPWPASKMPKLPCDWCFES